MFGHLLSPLLGDAPDGLWFPQEASNFAGEVDSTYDMILWISAVFFVGIVIALVWFPYKYHQPKGGRATSRVRHNNLLEISWSVFPSLLLVIMFVRGSWGYLDMREAPAGAAEVNVTSYQWGWTFDYGNGITSNELHVVKDRPSKLVMQSVDVIHSLYIPSFRIKRDVVPGRYNLLWFVPTVASEKVSPEKLEEALADTQTKHNGNFDPERYGIDGGNGFTKNGYTYFDLFCAEYCGKDHSQMHSYVVVHETEEDFQAWLVEANKKPEGMSLEDYGREMYNVKNCKSCHSLDGLPGTGPSFLGLFGRQEKLVGGETITVDENYIRESILEPMSKIVAGYGPVMPTFKGQVTDEQLSALVAYMKTLRQ